MKPSDLVRDLRRRSGLSVRGLAALAGVSPATVERIENDRVSPLRTLDRLAGAVGQRVTLALTPLEEPPLTREDRRSLGFHRLVAARLLLDPPGVLAKAHSNLATMREADSLGHAREPLDEWQSLLDGPLHELVGVLIDPGEHGRELRQSAPFAGVLSPAERARIYPAARHAARSA